MPAGSVGGRLGTEGIRNSCFFFLSKCHSLNGRDKQITNPNTLALDFFSYYNENV